ncbi:hypothetical protein A9Q81_10450 [Gammaproteobacteria bacterium 42_54_T18]|nr:hypothetical protein A9Q81_10450 [Gammaproteobacteria bacterium 42_54_T18]
MNLITNIVVAGVLMSYLGTGVASEQHHLEDSHNHGSVATNPREKDSHEDESSVVTISPAQERLASITVEPLNAKKMEYQVYSPGEVKANGYTSYIVSPRVDSVVIRRHVALGDHVDEGQLLVTLFSERVAEAQGAFRIANAEWRRVNLLGRKAVGDKRFVLAKTVYETSFSRLLVYGLSKEAVISLVAVGDETRDPVLGEYTLVANSRGVVLSDDFHQGQRVESGDSLIELTQEDTLWVEARLAPNTSIQLPLGTKAQINVGGNIFDANVVQAAHTIDPKTRTRIVRLLVNNESHQLHPGQFADVYFLFKTETPVLAVPETALMRSADGDWVVFVSEKEGRENTEAKTFSAKEVELGRFFGEWREIIGVEPGSRVVMTGAFFVASEIAKSGFDPHNH